MRLETSVVHTVNDNHLVSFILALELTC